MPIVSVVIPCYNQGEYLREAIASVEQQTFRDFEILVVDDGSTLPESVQTIDSLRCSPVDVIRTANKGLAAARNTGISRSRGKYILPLDADDKIGREYLEKAVAVLDAEPGIGIVYCEAEFFGAVRGRWELPPYAFPDILVSPRIFACAFFRRSAWETAGGYSSEMEAGWEDYDFWLSLIERGAGVHRIPEVLFYYRQHPGNMTTGLSREQYVGLFKRLFHRHRDMYLNHIDALFSAIVSHWEIPPHAPRNRHLTRLLVALSALRARLGLPVRFWRWRRKTR
ncbi:MAG TPA: glycosyltransferase [Candidatus Acidoferrales bacterium]|jgi:glycosyltransferase involved in cell wall biosynthesis|nr:glycosyltransferase [Candidatus Acidoferrales bacterium]